MDIKTTMNTQFVFPTTGTLSGAQNFPGEKEKTVQYLTIEICLDSYGYWREETSITVDLSPCTSGHASQPIIRKKAFICIIHSKAANPSENVPSSIALSLKCHVRSNESKPLASEPCVCIVSLSLVLQDFSVEQIKVQND
jgi:hypothetical protein